MDDADRAARQEEAARQDYLERAHLNAIRHQAQMTEWADLKKSERKCLYCGAPIKEIGRRWCNAFCRDEWEKENKA